MINANDIFQLENSEDYKLHLACRNSDGDPLELFFREPEKWIAWNRYRGKKNDWTRKFIFTLIEFRPTRDAWLFGGVFRVLARHEGYYDLEYVTEFDKFTGRVILSFHRYPGLRIRASNLENYLPEFELHKILPARYSGESFPGLGQIEHDFDQLESIVKMEREDWKAALSSVKGVYLITDKSNGKHYVGSAYGGKGIWDRWVCYIETGHGGNKDLEKNIKKNGIDHARKNFRFSLLEVMSMSVPDEHIIKRESHWKNVLLSRQFGYNSN